MSANLLVLTAFTGLLCAACGSAANTTRPTTTPTVKPGTPLSVHLVLPPGAFVIGNPIYGAVVFKNLSGMPVKIASNKCIADPGLAVGLTNKRISFNPAFTAEACLTNQWLNPGLTRFKVTIDTTYEGCMPASSHSSNAAGLLPCDLSGNLPDLPPGDYQTKIVWIGAPNGTVYPKPATITLQPLPSS
jgi:hypothetical protein